MIDFIKKRKEARQFAAALYRQTAAQARQPVFYSVYGVPDTIDGRFDLLMLHAFMVVEALGHAGRPGRRVAQLFFDEMFRSIDRGIRESGVGDLSVPKHMKRMMRAFKGRSAAYYKAMQILDQGDAEEELREALRRNLYATIDAPSDRNVSALSAYVRHNTGHLRLCALDMAAGADISFIEIDTIHMMHKENRDDNAGMVA